MLVTSPNLNEYFRDAICSARERTGVVISDEAEAYLVRLLGSFSRAENVFAGTDRGEDVAMATLLSRAREAEPVEALRIYKHMGDASLYFTGFFSESVDRRIVSADYYVSMGETAYASVAGLMRTTAATSSALFAELSDRFVQLVNLLTVVSVQSVDGEQQVTSSTVVELVDRYRRTGRPELLEALERLGVVLRESGPDDVVH